MAFDQTQHVERQNRTLECKIASGSIAVLIVNFNSGPYLARTLASISAQQRSADEVIIVDNASTDGSIDLVPWASYPQMHLIRLFKNTGFAVATNLAAGIATSDWLAMLNCDATAEPDWLTAMASAAERNQATGIFASTQVNMDAPHLLDGAGDVLSVTGLAWRGGYGRPTANIPQEGVCFGACAAGAFISRELFLDLGGFEESFFCYLEDLDFSYRAQLSGLDCIYVPAARIHHKGTVSSAKMRDWPLRLSARNRIFMYVRNTPFFLFLATWPFFLMGLVLSVAHGAKHGHAIPVMAGVLDGCRGLPEALSQRRRISPPFFPPLSLVRLLSWNPFSILTCRHRVQKLNEREALH